MPRYLISFLDPHTGGGFINGSFELPLPEPIRGMDDISRLQEQLIRLRGLNNPMIMGFSVFDGEGGSR